MNPQSTIHNTLKTKILMKGGKKTMVFNKEPEKEKKLPVSFSYPINTILRTDYHNISLQKNQKIFFCCYQISVSTRRKRTPFLLYTLWKYPKSNKEYSDLFIFPFCVPKNNNWKYCMKHFKSSLHKENSVLKGFLSNKNGIFLLFQDELAKNKLTIKYRNKQKWWGTISEICNHRHILKFPIHKTVYNLFFQNPKLIYLIDQQKRKIEIPAMGYYGNIVRKIPMEAVLGTRKIRKAAQGPFYYYADYNAAFRYATWTAHYQTKDAHGMTVADKEGKYLSDGAILRLVLFLGKTKVLLNHNSDNKSVQNTLFENLLDGKGEWSENYDSVLVGRAPLSNGFPFKQLPAFTLKKFKQHTVLSIHIVDKKMNPRTWNAYYSKFTIK